MRKVSLVLLALLLMSGIVLAQAPYKDQPTVTTRDYMSQPVIGSGSFGNIFSGILDPSRLEMSHSVGMGYASFGGEGYTQGYYLNTMRYNFDSPVRLTMRLGMTNNPFASSGGPEQGQGIYSGLFQNAELFGGADLEWQPKENMFLKLSVNRYAPGMLNNGYGRSMFYDPWYSSYNTRMDHRWNDPFGY